MKLKKLLNKYTLVSVLVISSMLNIIYAQSIGINVTGALANSKALLDVDATGLSPKKGLLIPRMTTLERNAITAPIPESLLIYNTTTQCFEAWNQATTTWVAFGCIAGCSIPSSPIANSAVGTSTIGFTANWNAASGATSYLLDISTSPSFSSFVSGYNSLNVGNVLSLSVSSLTCATTYYYRVVATNTCGVSAASNIINVTTPNCPIILPTSAICGSQEWELTNLNVGTMITSGTAQTNNGIVEKYCYNDIASNCTTYGGLYFWNEMMNYSGSVNCDPCGSGGRQGICSAGYHIPTDLEWSRYEHCLESTLAPVGGTSLSTFQTTTGFRGTNAAGVGPGDKLKVTSSNSPSWDGTNTSVFGALPSGLLNASGSFATLNSFVFYWTGTENSPANPWYRYTISAEPRLHRVTTSGTPALSVRCLKN